MLDGVPICVAWYMCVQVCVGGVYYMRSCAWRLACWVLKNWWFTFFLIHFRVKLIWGGVEKKDTGYSKRYFKNGPKVLDQSLQMSPRTGSAIAKTSFDGERERERKKSPSGAPILTP